MLRAFAFALAAFFALPAAAQARDATITSFDGTQIVLSFFPSPNGGKAPTILEGHGWGGSRETNQDAAADRGTGHRGGRGVRRPTRGPATSASARCGARDSTS